MTDPFDGLWSFFFLWIANHIAILLVHRMFSTVSLGNSWYHCNHSWLWNVWMSKMCHYDSNSNESMAEWIVKLQNCKSQTAECLPLWFDYPLSATFVPTNPASDRWHNASGSSPGAVAPIYHSSPSGTRTPYGSAWSLEVIGNHWKSINILLWSSEFSTKAIEYSNTDTFQKALCTKR